MKKIISKINIWTGYRFWYQVKVFYKARPESGQPILDFTEQIGLVHKSSTIVHRDVAKLFPLHKRGVPKHLLNNGIVYYEITAYLGWFAKPTKK